MLLVVGCREAPRPPQIDSAAAVAALRDTLVRLGTEDQKGRDSLMLAVSRNDTLFLQRTVRGDSARTRWVKAYVAAHGWPRRSIMGDSALNAAWMIVQHSPDDAFRAEMLPLLERAASSGDVSPADVAMLADRVAVNRGQSQRYGTQFSLREGKLVLDPIADFAALDSLRAAVGLPPMQDYVRMLAEMNRMPVEWPPARR